MLQIHLVLLIQIVFHYRLILVSSVLHLTYVTNDGELLFKNIQNQREKTPGS